MGLWEYADRRKYLANDTIEMCQAAKVDGWLRSRGRYRLQENRDVGIDRCQERSGAGDVVVDRVPINQDLDVKILGTGELQALGVLVPRWTFASIGGQLDIHADDVDQRQDFLELLGEQSVGFQQHTYRRAFEFEHRHQKIRLVQWLAASECNGVDRGVARQKRGDEAAEVCGGDGIDASLRPGIAPKYGIGVGALQAVGRVAVPAPQVAAGHADEEMAAPDMGAFALK